MDKEGYSTPKNFNKNTLVPKTLPLSYSSQTEENDEEKVLKEISKILAAAKRRAPVIIGVAAIVTAGLLFRITKQPPIFVGSFQLLVEPVTTSESRLQAILTETEGNQWATINGKDFGMDYVTQIKVLKSPLVMSPITEEIREKYPDFNPNEVNVTRPFEEDQGTRIIEVSFQGKNEEKVRLVLEKVAEGYLEYRLEDRQTNLRQGIEFIEEQIPKQQARVNSLQEELANLRESYDLMNPEFSSNKLIDKIYTLDMRIVEIDVELAAALSVYKTKKKLLAGGNYLAVLAGEGDIYGTLVAKIQNLRVEVAEALTRLASEHPTLISLLEQKQKLEREAYIQADSIVEKHEGQIEGLQDQKNSLEAAQKKIKEVLEVLPKVARQYSNLERELKVATESLNDKLAKREALELDAAQQDVPWELIAPPYVGQAPKTNRKAIALTAIGGFILGMAAGFVLEIFNNVFHAPEDIEEDTQLPLLATIPFSSELKRTRGGLQGFRRILLPLTSVVSNENEGTVATALADREVSGSYNYSPVWEAFRSLYTNIRLLSDDMQFHSLVIGAASPGEGKSTVALNFAQTAAAMGQRVLLVDADLRNPKIHKKLDLPNLRGLSNAISSDLSLNDAIQRSPLDENLFILTAGSVPPDPVKLLSSKKAQYLMEQFEAFFDLVIYDTPPVVNLADASLIAARTDGVILVVGLEKTDRSLVMKALDGFNLSGGSVLGVVANKVKS